MAIRRVATPDTQIVILGSGERNAQFGPTSRGSFAGFGVDLVVPLGSDDDGPVDLPPSLAVGAWLVRDTLGPNTGATGHSVGRTSTDLPSFDGPDPIALVVIGDGTACRTEKGPGYLRPGAAAFDARVAAALARGDGYLLHRELLYRDDEDDALMAAGVPVWDELTWTVEAQAWDAELLYDDAPLGVGYFVAAWTLRPLTPEQVTGREQFARIRADVQSGLTDWQSAGVRLSG